MGCRGRNRRRREAGGDSSVVEAACEEGGVRERDGGALRGSVESFVELVGGFS